MIFSQFPHSDCGICDDWILQLFRIPMHSSHELSWIVALNIATDTLIIISLNGSIIPLQWRHNEHHGVSNCLFSCLFRRISKKTSKIPYWPLWGEFTEHGKCFHLMTSPCITSTPAILYWKPWNKKMNAPVAGVCAGQWWPTRDNRDGPLLAVPYGNDMKSQLLGHQDCKSHVQLWWWVAWTHEIAHPRGHYSHFYLCTLATILSKSQQDYKKRALFRHPIKCHIVRSRKVY